MGNIVPIRKLPSDFELACDTSLSKEARREAWDRFEKSQWADAHFNRGLRVGSLEQKFAVYVVFLINHPHPDNFKRIPIK